jgi:hypothetical protein
MVTSTPRVAKTHPLANLTFVHQADTRLHDRADLWSLHISNPARYKFHHVFVIFSDINPILTPKILEDTAHLSTQIDTSQVGLGRQLSRG